MQQEQRVFNPDIHDDAERRRVLADNCDGEEDGYYVKELSDDEILERREQLVNTSLVLREKETEKKEWVDTWKQAVKPHVLEKERLLTELKTGQVDMNGKLYLVANHVDGVMEYYNENGVFIKDRKLKPTERQSRLFIPGGSKTGTN